MDENKSTSNNRSLEAGRKLCSPEQGEDVVISGMAGHFPNCNNAYKLRENLFNKVDLISEDCRRWKSVRSDVPHRTGKLNKILSFDAGFFGVHHRRANNMDPQIRLLLERIFEVIVDAGYNPSELKGSNTGVFIGTSICESEIPLLFKRHLINGGILLGLTRSMMSQYISYFFEFQGPSFVADSACCSSMQAMYEAYRSIRHGFCDTAVVATANMCLHPMISQQFAACGILSMDGISKVFCEGSDGYVRSETICTILLQKSKDARRMYASIVHCKTSCDGYKAKGITHPSSDMQTILMKEIYNECNVDVSTMSYIEAHGTGTHVGDIEELNSIAEVFCSKREKPLFIGSMKSNIGHSEAASGIASVIKILLAMESSSVPPNLNYTKPRKDIEVLVSGQLKVVTDKMSWPDSNGLAGVSSFGFGGSIGHMVLRWNEKLKTNDGVPADNLPRLICVSGRTLQVINDIWNDLEGRKLDGEFVKLIHAVFGKNILSHQFRGYQILSKIEGELVRSVKEVPVNKRKLLWIFTNFEAKWPVVGKQLMGFPLFNETVKIIHDVLGQYFDMLEIVRNFDEQSIMNQILTTMALQLSLANIMKELEIIPDFVIGLGTGELIAAYVEDRLSIIEVVTAHLYVSVAFQKSGNNKIAKGSYIYEELASNLNNLIPKGIEPSKKCLPLQKFGQGINEHFIERIISPISFEEIIEFIPNSVDSLVVGAKGQSSKYLSLVNEDSDDFIIDFLTSLGDLYENGHDMHLDKLYPKISWPVSRNTPMISPLIKWNHDHNWYVEFYNNEDEVINGLRFLNVNIKEQEWSFVTGHIIDGKNLFPITGYLKIVWETLAMMSSKLPADMKITFERVKFLRCIDLTAEEDFDLLVTIQRGNGNFEVIQNDIVLITGVVYEVENTWKTFENVRDFSINNSTSATFIGQEDIYKELRIRGYLYEGAFKALLQGKIDNSEGLIMWTGNWIPFMDAMLQYMLLQINTKSLHLVISVEQIIIDAPMHMNMIEKLRGEEKIVPVKIYNHLNAIRSGAIEFKGMKFTTISKSNVPNPILQIYKFIPNKATLSLEESVTTMVQIIVENNFTNKIKSVEVTSELELISIYITQALEHTPLIIEEPIVLSKASLNLNGVIVQDKELSDIKGSHIVIVSNAFQQNGLLEASLNAVKDTNGYVITRESVDFNASLITREGLNVLCFHNTNTESLILLQKPFKRKQPTFIEISDDLAWLPLAQEAVKNGRKLIIYSQNKPTSGILGLANCLRSEPNSRSVSCFFMMSEAPKFDPNHEFYYNQLHKNLAVNVWNAGEWGTYRHMPFTGNFKTQYEYCYAKVTEAGDLSSIKFNHGDLHKFLVSEPENELIYVHFSAINFSDITTVSHVNSRDRIEEECIRGIDFSGRSTISGKRVMGLASSKVLGTLIIATSPFMWDIPEEWSMEDAATVPAVYLTVIYSLMMRAYIKRGQTILINSGIGGISEATINIALHFDCNIFVIVNTKEEKDYFRQTYSQIKSDQISNTYDMSFEHRLLLRTNGRGVDIIVNALPKEQFLSPVSCLIQNGQFVHIELFDTACDKSLELGLFKKSATFHGIAIDTILRGKRELKIKLSLYIADFIQKGVVKPLCRKVFQKDEIFDALKFMNNETCMKRVLVQMQRKEEETELCDGLPRCYCDPEGTYIILGGLGGFGLQLADWLVSRGARKLILITRTGVTTGYQSRMLMFWKYYGTEVVVRKDDVTTKEGCIELITYANFFGPIKGIFNLAAVIKDGLFENQSVDNYQTSLAPKAIATEYLDVVTRKMCPQLRHFVVFSSVVSGIGNPGQTNYGMTNSVMERICEQRKADGFPALAIQWGPIGDVGLIAEMKNDNKEWMKRGIMQQRISNCLEVLDILLMQSEPIVSSMVLAEKCGSGDNIVDVVLKILTSCIPKNVNLYSTFPELGMDSLTSLEIKQTLEKDYEVFLSVEDLRKMTLAELQLLSVQKVTIQHLTKSVNEEGNLFENMETLLQSFFDEVITEPITETGGLKKENNAFKVYLLPRVKGEVSKMKLLGEKLDADVHCLQLCSDGFFDTIFKWVESILSYVDAKSNTFVLVAHSFDCVIATALTNLLEQGGRIGKLVFLDGAPGILREVVTKQFETEREEVFETKVLCTLFSKYLTVDKIPEFKAGMLKCASLEERIRLIIDRSSNLDHSFEYLINTCLYLCELLKAVIGFSFTYPKLKSKVKLIKSKRALLPDSSNDYGPLLVFGNLGAVEEFEGEDFTILENPEVVHAINKFIYSE